MENVRGSDVTVILSNFCFIQYNIGGENEYDPKHWMVRTFIYNSLTYNSIHFFVISHVRQTSHFLITWCHTEMDRGMLSLLIM